MNHSLPWRTSFCRCLKNPAWNLSGVEWCAEQLQAKSTMYPWAKDLPHIPTSTSKLSTLLPLLTDTQLPHHHLWCKQPLAQRGPRILSRGLAQEAQDLSRAAFSPWLFLDALNLICEQFHPAPGPHGDRIRGLVLLNLLSPFTFSTEVSWGVC